MSILFLIYIFTKDNQITKNEKQFIAPPEVSNGIEAKFVIKSSLTNNDFQTIPTSLKYIKQVKLSPFTDSELSKISENLDFLSLPTEVNDIKNGKFLIWNNPKYSLFIYPQIRKIKYAPSTNPIERINNTINKQLEDKEYLELATSFLTNKINLDKNNLKFSNYLYLKPVEGYELYKEVERVDSKIIQVNFYYSEAEYPIYTENAQDTQIYVQFTKDGTVLNSEISLYSEYKKAELEYRLKNFDEFNSKLNEAVLVNIDSSNVNLPDIKSDLITDIEINKIELVYLQENLTTEILQPVFLLRGILHLKDNINRSDAVFYLPAYSVN